ncbi:MAG: hypothetical protein CMN30_06230 [Sandaracinus sp.]|nr:hypothetical protein [Sandaracinus sp.]|tara:strand:+ start:2648 stop:3646 length:999 start_codon:yes stop_codon:yes gene_type:complete
MPRQPRDIDVADVAHARTRFMNEEFRINTPLERALVLDSLGRAAIKTDAAIFAFAIMSNHLHVVVQRNEHLLERLYRSFHTSIAMRLNGLQRRLGSLVAGRPWIDAVHPDRFVHLLRYVHGNQRACGAAPDLRSSDWTSHPMYCGLVPRRSWLRIELAAELAGYGGDADGIARLVAEIEGPSVGPAYEPSDTTHLRREVRRRLAGPVEVSTPRHGGDGRLEVPLVVVPGTRVRTVADITVEVVVAHCAVAVGLSVEELRAKGRRLDRQVGRMLALRIWTDAMQNPTVAMSGYLGLSESAAARARRSLSAAGRRAQELAPKVFAELRAWCDVA